VSLQNIGLLNGVPVSVLRRLSRFTAVIALAVGVITFDGLPGQTTPVANASVTLAAPWQYGGSVIAGGAHMCFVGNTDLNCAGDNSQGQLGTGATTDFPYGKKVQDATNNMLLANAFASTAGLNHTCMLTSSTGIMYCWGDNQYGQLGDGTTIDRLVPTIVADNSASGFVNTGIQKLVAGHNHMCAIKLGQMYCWGRNDQGQLGNASTTDSSLAVKPGAPFNAADAMGPIAAGDGHTCAVLSTGNRDVYCWGDNQYGQLGDGTIVDKTSPVIVSGVLARNAQHDGKLAAGANFTCVESGTAGSPVLCWGRNNKGQLSDGTSTDSNIPVVAVAAGVNGQTTRYIGAGADTVCMRSILGASSPTRSVLCWGDNSSGQIAGSANAMETQEVVIAANSAEGFDPSANENFNNIAISKSSTTGFACFAKWCWGSNASGQLATGDTNAVIAPTKFKIGSVQQSGGGGSGGSGGGGNSGPALASAAATEIAGLKVQITVTGLATGASLRVMAYESGYNPVGMVQEVPSAASGTVGSSTMTVNGITWLTVGMSPTSRLEAFVAGKSYDFIIYQSLSGSMGATILKTVRLTGTVVDASAVTTTTVAPQPVATTTTTTVAPKPILAAAAIPGVTVTDTKVYATTTPKKVAEGSAIAVMTREQAKVNDVVTLTPRVCVVADDDLVFIKTGQCVAQMVNEKTGKVLRTLKTTIVGEDVSELNVGNEIVTLAPIYFAGGSAEIDAVAKKRLSSLKSKVTSAGTVLLVGHSGILMGNTPENQVLGRTRAIAARDALKKMGSKGPFYFSSAGALDPATKVLTVEAQAKNRRVVIVLIP
jgi:alpha-tubulin suppressor-like RCC1 family protein/outer membrane protein OmpA-like peptidoglycan-associated protein